MTYSAVCRLACLVFVAIAPAQVAVGSCGDYLHTRHSRQSMPEVATDGVLPGRGSANDALPERLPPALSSLPSSPKQRCQGPNCRPAPAQGHVPSVPAERRVEDDRTVLAVHSTGGAALNSDRLIAAEDDALVCAGFPFPPNVPPEMRVG